MKIVAVIGSINMDIVIQVNRHPEPGETLKGTNTRYIPGGKGANQAIAASRAGGDVDLIGAVGNDLFSTNLLNSLQTNKVNIQSISEKESTSGLAFITVDALGENRIILEEGANGLLMREDILNAKSILAEATVILLQNEIPWETNQFVIETASTLGVPVFLNPAPAIKIPKKVLPFITGLILNEKEVEILTGLSVKDIETAKKAAQTILKDGVKEVIITLGEKGSYYADTHNVSIYTPGFKVKVVDTTAAGDTFIGAYIVARNLGETKQCSLRYATAASAITVTKSGAQCSIPQREEINRFLSEIGE